jgi:hypothetical protein
MISFSTRFPTSPAFAEALSQAHSKGLAPQTGMMCKEGKGRLFFDINSIQWVRLTVFDYEEGLKFAFSDDRHFASTELLEWRGLDQALMEFDRVILWHSLNEEPMPELQWFDYQLPEGELEAI